MTDARMFASTTPRWSHVALNCRDPQATERFYRRHFGFRRARVVPLGHGDEVVFLRAGDVYLEIMRADPGSHPEPPVADGPHRPGLARHIAFQTDDLDLFLSRVGTEATVSHGPLSHDDVLPGWRSVWLADPDGVVVEVSQGYRDYSRGSGVSTR